MRIAIAAACALVALVACASAESVKDAQGQGVTRTFRQPYEAVYQAALNAAARRKFEVLEQDAGAGRIILSSVRSSMSFGERIGVFVTRAGDRSTAVEVVSRPVGGLLSFAPDWPALLFGDIDQDLTPRRYPQ